MSASFEELLARFLEQLSTSTLKGPTLEVMVREAERASERVQALGGLLSLLQQGGMPIEPALDALLAFSSPDADLWLLLQRLRLRECLARERWEIAEDALQKLRASAPSGHPVRELLGVYGGYLRARQGDADSSQEAYAKALRFAEESEDALGAEEIALSLAELPAEFGPKSERLLEVLLQHLGKHHPGSLGAARILTGLARIEETLGLLEDARNHMEQVAGIYEKELSRAHPAWQACAIVLRSLARRAEDEDDAMHWESALLEAQEVDADEA